MRIVGMTVLILSIIGCGGGSGGGGSDSGGGDEPFYAGRWRGSTVLVRNTCPRGIDIQDVIQFDVTVNQAERDIVVDILSATGSGTDCRWPYSGINCGRERTGTLFEWNRHAADPIHS